jgi:uncharacterized protein (TIGR00251 family)
MERAHGAEALCAPAAIMGCMASLVIRLQPRAKRNAILDERDGVLRVSVAAAPVDGRANAALCKLIAKRAGVARGRVSVVRGERSREKVVEVDGVALEDLRRALLLDDRETQADG